MNYKEMRQALDARKLVTRPRFDKDKFIHFYSHYEPNSGTYRLPTPAYFKLKRNEEYNWAQSYKFSEEDIEGVDWYCLPDDFYLQWKEQFKEI